LFRSEWVRGRDGEPEAPIEDEEEEIKGKKGKDLEEMEG
jgi:hypothetical protein